MSRDETRQAFVNLIRPYVKIHDIGAVTDDSRFVEDLQANSARLVDIVLETEDHFDIQIDDKEADSLLTVGDAVSLILAKSG